MFEPVYLEQQHEQDQRDQDTWEMFLETVPTYPPVHFQTVIKNGRRTRPRPSAIYSLIW
jgi:hypothetical protein